MGAIWTEENKYRMWLAVETCCQRYAGRRRHRPRRGGKSDSRTRRDRRRRIQEIEAEVKHDVIAFTTAVAEKIGPESRWLHYGLTSNDVVDTAQALQIKAASAIIAEGS